MRHAALCVAGWGVVLVSAALLRLVDLGNRPMHCDEAVHAVKFGALLERGEYVYDPEEYHGPSLNFLTLPVARLASAEKLTEVTEVQLRLIPAIGGVVLVGLVWLLRDQLGHTAALCAAGLTAVSPAMVFYSRYYIQEMLLVCFTFAAIVSFWRFASSLTMPRNRHVGYGSVLWLALLGLSIGMMHASKETCVISLFAIAVAAPPTIYVLRQIGVKRALLSAFIVALSATAVSALFFSSFLDNPRGILDSFATYHHYLERASGEGSVGQHVHPWHYYLRILFWWQRGGGPVWTEAMIGALALVAMVSGVAGKRLGSTSVSLVRFLSIYTLVMIVVYSALPYKTPWCAIGFLHGLILLAGVGATVLFRAAPGRVGKAAVMCVLLAATLQLAWQSWRASFVAFEAPGNPYVYSHTTSDVPVLVEQIERVAEVHPDGRAMPVHVLCPDHDYWPLPWYLRGLSRVGWWGGMPRGPAAPVVIVQPEMETVLLTYLFERQPPGKRHLYVPLAPEQDERDWQLRPHVPLLVYVRRDAWETYQTH